MDIFWEGSLVTKQDQFFFVRSNYEDLGNFQCPYGERYLHDLSKLFKRQYNSFICKKKRIFFHPFIRNITFDGVFTMSRRVLFRIRM